MRQKLYISYLIPSIDNFSKKICFQFWGLPVETCLWALDALVAAVVELLQALSADKTGEYLCVY